MIFDDARLCICKVLEIIRVLGRCTIPPGCIYICFCLVPSYYSYFRHWEIQNWTSVSLRAIYFWFTPILGCNSSFWKWRKKFIEHSSGRFWTSISISQTPWGCEMCHSTSVSFSRIGKHPQGQSVPKFQLFSQAYVLHWLPARWLFTILLTLIPSSHFYKRFCPDFLIVFGVILVCHC